MKAYIGYSKGKSYRVLKVNEEEPLIGLVELEEFLHPCWCTFEKIEEVPIEFDCVAKNGRIIDSGVPYELWKFRVRVINEY